MKYFSLLFLVLSFVFNASANSFNDLEKLAVAKTKVEPRVTLSNEESLKAIKNAEPLESGNVPNYIRALAQNTKAAPQFADLVQTFIFGGTIKPETKMAMGLKIAEQNKSAYIFAHAQRWLKASENGTKMFGFLRENKLESLTPADQAAIRYASLLTGDVQAITDEEFGKVRAFYNDSQIVELTMNVCFFNHFTRFVEAVNLPVEDWVLNGTPKVPAAYAKYSVPPARIGLISDNEMAATQKMVEASKAAQTPQQGLGIGIANSQRARSRNRHRKFAARNVSRSRYGGGVARFRFSESSELVD